MLIYNIPPHLRGDTWSGISSINIVRNNQPLDLTDATIKMQLREDVDSPIILELSTVDGSISISNPAAGTFTVLPKLINIPFGSYLFDIQITLSTGEVKTYIKGSWEILPDITE